MVNKKVRRKNGYVTPRLTISKKDLLEEDLFLNPHYSDWDDWRDGFREWFKDFKQIKKINPRRKLFLEELYEKRVRMNKKQKKLLKRRKARRLRKCEKWDI